MKKMMFALKEISGFMKTWMLILKQKQWFHEDKLMYVLKEINDFMKTRVFYIRKTAVL